MPASEPSVRLAYNPGPIDAYGALGPRRRRERPVGAGQAERNSHGGLEAPTVRLAVTTAMGQCGADTATGPARYPMHHARRDGGELLLPALLVSYVYLAPFQAHRARYAFRDWVLDSGAYSAYQSGTAIDLAAYIACCRDLLATDPTLTEVIALDVVGDWRASAAQTAQMWDAGVPAIPVFHIGEPWSLLADYCARYPKVGLSCRFGESVTESWRWVEQCFARQWPHRFHSFGWTQDRMLLALPFHSADATSWELGPCKYGRWRTFGQLSVRGSQQNPRAEVQSYLTLEARLWQRWRREMAQLAALPTPWPCRTAPTVRLAVQQGSDAQIARSGLAPAVRIALGRSRPATSDRVADALGAAP